MSFQGSWWVLTLWLAPGGGVCRWTPREPAVWAAPTALWLPFHPQRGSLALPALRPCLLQVSFYPKPRGGPGSAGHLWDQELKGERQTWRRGSGRARHLGLRQVQGAEEVAGRGGGVSRPADRRGFRTPQDQA